ncbi:uncharacterized protein LOC127837737 [Dreissena polymorpha]|nr:uncharacterized protein LOC127837737 [Dreissena polymorpha]
MCIQTKMLFVWMVLLWVCEGRSGMAAVNSQHLQMTDVPCTVTSPFESPLISAHLEKLVTSSGCVTNNTNPETGAEVHVIRFHGKLEANVELRLEDPYKTNFDKPIVVVLASDVKVFWHVRIQNQPEQLQQHTFIVSHQSGFRFANKNIRTRPKIIKPKTVPFETSDLVTWVTSKFTTVTTYTSLDGGQEVTLDIGKAVMMPQALGQSSECLNNLMQTGTDQQLAARATQSVQQPLTGCQIRHRFTPNTKIVYVIELKNVDTRTPLRVDVHLTLESNPEPEPQTEGQQRFRSRHGNHGRQGQQDKSFWLVLKSPPNVQWYAHCKQKDGFIAILHNSESTVDGEGLKPEYEARVELLKESGMDLVRWASYYLDSVALYTAVNNSNRIDIKVPYIVEQKLAPRQIKEVLKNSMTLECDSEQVTVAVPRRELESLQLKVNDLTLLDSSCTAERNSTHVYISSQTGTCQTVTSKIHSGIAHSNVLVIRTPSSVTDHDVDDDSIYGSGMEDIFSGSGDGGIVDDEDFTARSMKVEFTCEAAVDKRTSLSPATVFTLHMYDNSLFMAPISVFPVTVSMTTSSLYVQALASADPTLRAHMLNCWLGADNSDKKPFVHKLVENGCPVDPSVEYLQSGIPQSERLRFTMENYAPPSSIGVHVRLTCDVSLCCIVGDCGANDFPMCQDRSRGCHGNTVHSKTNTASTEISLGPVILTQISTKYQEPSVTQVTDSAGSSRSGVKEGSRSEPVIIEGLESGTVIGIAFAAFIIGAMMMGLLWFIHSHSGSLFSSGPFKQNSAAHNNMENDDVYVETTPGSSVPIST